MRRLTLSAVAATGLGLSVGVAACGSSHGAAQITNRLPTPTPAPAAPPTPTSAPPPAAQATAHLHTSVVRVPIRNFAFLPMRIVVSPGTRLIWTNVDSDPHTVTSDATGGALASAALDTNGRYTALLSKAGTFAYHCSIHPQMHGVIVVQA